MAYSLFGCSAWSRTIPLLEEMVVYWIGEEFPKILKFDMMPRFDSRGGLQLQARLPPKRGRPQRLVVTPDPSSLVQVRIGIPYKVDFEMISKGTPRMMIVLAKVVEESNLPPENLVQYCAPPQPPPRRVNPPIRRPELLPVPPPPQGDSLRRSQPLVRIDHADEKRRHFKPSARSRVSVR